MLAKLRSKHLQKSVLVTLTVIIIPGFILWGAASFISSQRKAPVAEIKGEKIYLETLNDIKKDALLAQFMATGKKFYEYDESQLNALAIERLMLLKKAANDNLKVTDQEIIEHIKKLFSINNKYNKRAYDNFIRVIYNTPRLRYTADAFEEFLRKELLVEKLRSRVFGSLTATKKEILQAYLEDTQQVNIFYAFIRYDAFKKNITVSAQELEKFYQDNKMHYTVPPKAEIEYVVIPLTNANGAPLSPSEREIKKYVKQSKNSLAAVAEKTRTSLKKDAYALHDDIKGIGYRPEINQKMFSVNDQQIQGPFLVDHSWVLFKKLRSLAQSIPSQQEVSEQLKSDLIIQISKKRAYAAANELITLLKNDAAITPLRVSYPTVSIGESGFFHYTQKDPIQNTFKLTPQLNTLLLSMLKKETVSQPYIYENEGLLVFKVLGKKNAKKFNEVKDTYREKVLMQKRIWTYVLFLQKLGSELNVKVYLPTK